MQTFSIFQNTEMSPFSSKLYQNWILREYRDLTLQFRKEGFFLRIFVLIIYIYFIESLIKSLKTIVGKNWKEGYLFMMASSLLSSKGYFELVLAIVLFFLPSFIKEKITSYLYTHFYELEIFLIVYFTVSFFNDLVKKSKENNDAQR